MQYAGFWRRFSAFLIDIVVLLPVTVAVTWLSGKSKLFYLYYFVPSLLFGVWFHVHLVKQYGGTPGKIVMGLQISKLDGSIVGYKEATLRFAVMFILSTVASVAIIVSALHMTDSEYLSLTLKTRGVRLVEQAPSWYQPISVLMQVWIWSEFIVMLTNRTRRSMHDFIAGTVVVYRTRA